MHRLLHSRAAVAALASILTIAVAAPALTLASGTGPSGAHNATTAKKKKKKKKKRKGARRGPAGMRGAQGPPGQAGGQGPKGDTGPKGDSPSVGNARTFGPSNPDEFFSNNNTNANGTPDPVFGNAFGRHFTLATPSGKTLSGNWQISAHAPVGTLQAPAKECTGTVAGITDTGATKGGPLISVGFSNSETTVLTDAPFTFTISCTQLADGATQVVLHIKTSEDGTQYTSV